MYEQSLVVRCDVCGRPGTYHMCAGCIRRTDDDLSGIPGLYAALEESLEPSWGMCTDPRVTGGGRVGSPLPLRLEPLSLRANGGIVSVLRYWETEWRMVLGWTATPFRGTVEQSINGAVKFLRANLQWCADAYPGRGEFARSVRDWSAACRLQVNGPGDARLIGVCPTVADDGVVCGTSLWADPYAERIECRGCRVVWRRGEWMELGRRMRTTSQTNSLDNATAGA